MVTFRSTYLVVDYVGHITEQTNNVDQKLLLVDEVWHLIKQLTFFGHWDVGQVAKGTINVSLLIC